MRPQLFVCVIGVTLAGACRLGAIQPTIVAAPAVTAVPTAAPNRWQSREELAAWMSPGISTGRMSVVGEGDDALLRIELSNRDARLHGPDLEPAFREISSARLRFRWVTRRTSDFLDIVVHARPVDLEVGGTIPRLLRPGGAAVVGEERSGAWVERHFVIESSSRIKPPFRTRFAVINVESFGGEALEIDWIELVR